jgi:hypothetical protein
VNGDGDHCTITIPVVTGTPSEPTTGDTVRIAVPPLRGTAGEMVIPEEKGAARIRSRCSRRCSTPV